MDDNRVLDILLSHGGKLWENYGKRRVYFPAKVVFGKSNWRMREWKIYYDFSIGDFRIAGIDGISWARAAVFTGELREEITGVIAPLLH